MRVRSGLLLLFVVLFVAGATQHALAQERVLLENLNDLNGSQLAHEVARLESILPGAQKALSAVLNGRATTLLQDGNMRATNAPALAGIAAGHLSAEQRNALAAQAKADFDAVPSAAFEQLKNQYQVLTSLGTGRAELAATVRGWVTTNGADQLGLAELGWVAARLPVAAANADEFDVQWRGFVTAPTSGEYMFSISIRPRLVGDSSSLGSSWMQRRL